VSAVVAGNDSKPAKKPKHKSVNRSGPRAWFAMPHGKNRGRTDLLGRGHGPELP
jgi:hypothetical protein